MIYRAADNSMFANVTVPNSQVGPLPPSCHVCCHVWHRDPAGPTCDGRAAGSGAHPCGCAAWHLPRLRAHLRLTHPPPFPRCAATGPGPDLRGLCGRAPHRGRLHELGPRHQRDDAHARGRGRQRALHQDLWQPLAPRLLGRRHRAGRSPQRAVSAQRPLAVQRLRHASSAVAPAVQARQQCRLPSSACRSWRGLGRRLGPRAPCTAPACTCRAACLTRTLRLARLRLPCAALWS